MFFGVIALTLLILVSAVWVVTLKNLFRAALSLGIVLVGVAMAFLLLGAEFLGFVQILVYVGAILTLIVFAIMLTAKLQAADAITSRPKLPAVLAAAGIFGLLAWATGQVPWPAIPEDTSVDLAALGQRLVTTWVLPFEVISLVFVAVVIGAIAIAAPGPGKKSARSS